MTMPNPFRMQPLGPVQAYKTYAIRQPLATHWRRATCEEVGCEAFLKGWVTRVPAGSPQAEYIASKVHGRRFHETTGHGNLARAEREFMFAPGQPCFRASEHRLPHGRPPLYVVRGGDHRGNPSGERLVHRRPEDWAEDLGEHLDMIKERQEKG